jgi:hypothetical protein
LEVERERADIGVMPAGRLFLRGRVDRVEVLQVLELTGVAVRPRLEQRARDFLAVTVLGTGIPVAVAVRVEREALHQQTVVPDCLCRSSVAIFTGAVVAADPATLATEETEVSAAVVEVRLAQHPEERD